MNFEEVKAQSHLLLLKCVSGSRAYGLNTPHSDTDIKGIFVLPEENYFGFDQTEQVGDSKQDVVFFELRKFFSLLLVNNPNILELLNSPADSIEFKHPLMDLIKPEIFLSRLCLHSFSGYAYAQISKAKGLNKKILNPMEKERKTILDFCQVVEGKHSSSLKYWLSQKNFPQEDCGLVKMNGVKDSYFLFHKSQVKENFINELRNNVSLSNGKEVSGFIYGISSGPEANDVSLSEVPDFTQPLAMLFFNKEGYSHYCRDYRSYQDWLKNRNEQRYADNISHGKNYDAKNMMHTFRLLNMAEEIALYKEVRVRRADRDFLLSIRKGEYQYDDLLKMATEKTERIKELFEKSDLPEKPDHDECEKLLVRIRREFYGIDGRH
jgi:uncharacterized protein